MGDSDSVRAWAGILGVAGVTLGAFGAHALKETLISRNVMDSWKTAVQYQLLHALALLSVSTREVDRKSTVNWGRVTSLWVAGTILFSGSIYGLCLGGPRILGPVTPVGGLLLIGGWACLLFGSEGK